jgi:hypothetical protein
MYNILIGKSKWETVGRLRGKGVHIIRKRSSENLMRSSGFNRRAFLNTVSNLGVSKKPWNILKNEGLPAYKD